jgi:hypothetical protein
MTPPREGLLARLSAVSRRLEVHAVHPVPGGLTEPDPDGEERWEAGQVWAHMAEFPGYWLEQVSHIIEEVEAGSARAVPFGRAKTDPERIAAIERERRTAPVELFERVRTGIREAAAAVRSLPDPAWRVMGEHPTLRAMSVGQILERFVVAHLEEHAEQLDLLVRRAEESPPKQPAGISARRTWSVWSNLREHQVAVHLNQLTGSLRIDVDGATVVRRSGWKMGMSGTQVEFEVDGRPCLLMVRQRYAHTAGPEIDLYSEGRSLSTGEPLEERRRTHAQEVPNLMRMLIIFLPLIAVPSALRAPMEGADRGVLSGVVIAVGIGLALLGWLLSSRWYRNDPAPPTRHLVGGLIVAGCYVAFFVIFAMAVGLAG